MKNRLFFVGLSITLCCCCVLMIISISTAHWIDTKMNFTTDSISIVKSYQGLFHSCQDMILGTVKRSRCQKYSNLKFSTPAYRKAVQALLIADIVGTFIVIILSFALAFHLKIKSVMHLFLLTFFQVIPVFCGMVALCIYTSKNAELIDSKHGSPIFLGSTFGYSFICGWLSCSLGVVALLVSAISTLQSYLTEHKQFIARFEKLENV